MTDRETKMRELLLQCAPVIAGLAEELGYGYFRPSNPHDFSPDAELCTKEEIENHKQACELFDKGEYVHQNTPGMRGGVHILTAPWGIGSYVIRDKKLSALLAEIQEVSK